MTYASLQPPLSSGTVLLNRYQLLQVLGQGGFGRTYLAQDRNRFGESCVLKEFFPADSDPEFLAKARSLFQREARVLYDLHHPQIPQFREQFEFDQRLFLVQQYVPGKTYAQLLKERLLSGQPFAEAEVQQLLKQTLPVLTYLHQHQIIHRDIAPDNIILREGDNLPVLIDFGAVKELASRISHSGANPTIIGKPAYAPPEQMQVGAVKPSSDLYALAVTAVVLLTGKAPEQLYDAYTCRWQWQPWAQVSLAFANLLNRMLSDRPDLRFPTAEAVLAALQPIPMPAVKPAPASVSQLPTQAIGQHPHLPPPSSSSPAQWQPSLLEAARFLGRFLRWSLRLMGKLLWLIWQGVLAIVPRWVLLLALLTGGYWGYRQIIRQPVTLPRLPSIRLPGLPKPRLPQFSLPQWWQPSRQNQSSAQVPQSERSRRDALLKRMSQMEVPDGFFYEYVDTQFRQRHPEIAGDEMLSDSDQHRRLREEWYGTGETLLNRLDGLSAATRKKLGSFSDADVANHKAQLPQVNLTESEFDQIVERRFRKLFPDRQALTSTQATQIQRAIAADYLAQLQGRSGRR